MKQSSLSTSSIFTPSPTRAVATSSALRRAPIASSARKNPVAFMRVSCSSIAGIESYSSVAPTEYRATPSRRCRSEEHTSELQSPDHLVCRLLLEKKKKQNVYSVAFFERPGTFTLHV